jgi:hypothetical protein
MVGEFEGFESPEENWSKLPHALIEALPIIETVSEFKVITYILRHTWGFKDEEKRITLDEFANGRKRKDGTRLDSGTGLTIPSIRDGLKRGIEHGFIEHHQDATDKARVKNFYSLRMREGENCKKDSPSGKKSLPRSEKETLERNSKKEKEGASPAPDYLTDVFNGNVNLREGEKLIQRAGWDIHSSEHCRAMGAFLEASGLPIPRSKTTRRDWLSCISDHIHICREVSKLEDLYPRIIAHMRGDGLTVSRPGSVTNNLADWWAQEQNGGKPNGKNKGTSSGDQVRSDTLTEAQREQLKAAS